MTFAIRGDIIGDLGEQFHFTNEQLGWIAGAAFWGYVLCVFVVGQLCDVIGMGRLLALACMAHAGGVMLTIFASGFWSFWAGTLSIGLGNAFSEVAINPLVASSYPDQKTRKLNILHAWFPWGIVIGGLLGWALSAVHASWQVKMSLILLPIAAYGIAFFGQTFPKTERVRHGISTAAMYRELWRPRFALCLFCMLLTAATELGPNQWIPNILTKTANFPGILVLAWINGLMAIGRMLAGPVVHRLSPTGVLIAAAICSALGLWTLSTVTTAIGALLASALFAVGVCYFWPTMLGITAEWFPAGGALLLAIIGGVGNLSVALILPAMGKVYDLRGPQVALQYVSVLPAILVCIFAALWLSDRARGGYRAIDLAASQNRTPHT